MGKVVNIDTAGTEPQAARRRRAGRKPSTTALVLGGGGFTGGVYEIGALRAIDLLATNRTVNQFDIYVGTSAGAFVSSLVANGVTPEEMMRVLNRDLPSPLRDIDLSTLLRPNYRGFLKQSLTFPFKLAGVLRELADNLGEVSPSIWQPASQPRCRRACTRAAIERYVEEVLSDPDRTNVFRLLERELYLVATDLDTTERVIFGEGEWADVPISEAVAAFGRCPESTSRSRSTATSSSTAASSRPRTSTSRSSAVPGSSSSSTCSSPTSTTSQEHPDDLRLARAAGSDMGIAAIANQTFRLLSHDRLHRAVEIWEERYPGVDHPDRTRAR